VEVLKIFANGGAFVLLGNRIPAACFAVAFKIIITAKLLQLSRIANADGGYSSAPIAQMQCYAPCF
jgi:hypothetical protein